MKKYTRKQLIKAQIATNKDFLENKEQYGEIENTEDCAESQIDNILSNVN